MRGDFYAASLEMAEEMHTRSFDEAQGRSPEGAPRDRVPLAAEGREERLERRAPAGLRVGLSVRGTACFA